MSGKRALIRGTAILTITSFVTRFMGFFYRIFLGHTFGEENVGLYQLVFPVYALGISFSCAGTELALSRCVAQENAAGHPEKAKELLKTGLIFQMRRTADFIVLYVSFCFNPQLHLRLFAWLKADKNSCCFPTF